MRKLGFIFIAISGMSFASCQPCKDCKVVTYVNGQKDNEGNPEEYCGSDLTDIEGQSDTVGNTVSTYECN